MKKFVVWLLNTATSWYLKRNKIIVIGVAGSVGKSSTVSAVRTVLAQKYQVHFPTTTYNTNKSIHLELFNLAYATSNYGWAKNVVRILYGCTKKASYQVAVIELGTDHPGELASFAFLRPDFGIVTAVTPEHMEFFKTIDVVAHEELSISAYCSKVWINRDTVAAKFLTNLPDNANLFGSSTDFYAESYTLNDSLSSSANFHIAQLPAIKQLPLQIIGEHGLHALIAASTIAYELGLSADQISAGLTAYQPVKGRMQPLHGINGSAIIDDTYNASPDAMIEALKVLYAVPAKKRIAVLGSMNEMGDYSEEAHKNVGHFCDPKMLELVVTIGAEATKFLASIAEAQGCQVKRFTSPYEAGAYLHPLMTSGTVLLAKGSQNGVFAEEALKPLLAHKADQNKLVRQSKYWLDIKARQFMVQ